MISINVYIMDTTQLLLTVTLSVTTIFLIVVGIQLFFVLRETQRTLKRVNDIVAGFEKLGMGVEHGISEVFGFVTGAKTLFKALDHLSKRKNDKHKKS